MIMGIVWGLSFPIFVLPQACFSEEGKILKKLRRCRTCLFTFKTFSQLQGTIFHVTFSKVGFLANDEATEGAKGSRTTSKDEKPTL